MSEIQVIEGVEYMRNAEGGWTPTAAIKEVDVLRDTLVYELAGKAVAANEHLRRVKLGMIDDLSAFEELSAEKYGAKIGGAKGNITMFSYDRKYKVTRQVADYIAFDERLQAAKALIDECLIEWSKGSNAYIVAIIKDAFKVDRKGNLNTQRILSLRKHNIPDERWKNAMQAIADSVQVIGSATYARVYERDSRGEYRLIPLDIASL